MGNFSKFLNHYSNFYLKKNFKHLILHVTNHCNFRCSHCFVDFSNPQKDLKLNYYENISKKINNLFWLDIGGGEPFLRKDLYKIINLFEKQIVTIPTNGWLLENILGQIELIDKRETELVINLSLDGLEKTHNTVRKNDQSWEKVWKTFEALKKVKNIKTRFITVIHNQNYHEIIPLMKLIQERGADFHSVILLRGQTLDSHVKLPSFEDLDKLAIEIFKILEKYNYGTDNLSAKILRNYHRYLWKVSMETLRKQDQIVPCLAGKSHLVVWGNGDVSSCEMLPSIGNIRESEIDKITEGDAFRSQVESIKKKECNCTHNCAFVTSIFYNPKKWPQLVYQKKPQ